MGGDQRIETLVKQVCNADPTHCGRPDATEWPGGKKPTVIRLDTFCLNSVVEFNLHDFN